VAAGFTIHGPASFVSATNPVTLTGTAPIEVKTIWVNGVAIEPTWTVGERVQFVGAIVATAYEHAGIGGHDANDVPVPGAVVELTIDYVGPPPPEWNRLVRINEWMAANNGVVRDPADGNADDWFELYNTGAAPGRSVGLFPDR
jgi:hypothetical protein